MHTAAPFATFLTASAVQAGEVVVWSEHTEFSSVYPRGVDGALAEHLAGVGVDVRTTGFDGDSLGLDPHALDGIDVLLWFGHRRHDDVPQALAGAIAHAVQTRGMGFVALHSAHFSRPFRTLLGATGAWRTYVERAGPVTIAARAPTHPLWAHMADFTLPVSEIYREPFEVPTPDVVVAQSRWPDGECNRELMAWQRGKGRVVYLASGHETYPIFHVPQMVQLVRNAIAWARPS